MPASLRIEIFPSDLERMIGFYCNVLCFTLIKQDDTYAYLNRDNIFIGAIETENTESVEQRGYCRPFMGVELVIEVDDLQKERDFIVEKGWILEANIMPQPWGLQDIRWIDPDGYYLRFTTHSPKKDGKGALA